MDEFNDLTYANHSMWNKYNDDFSASPIHTFYTNDFHNFIMIF